MLVAPSSSEKSVSQSRQIFPWCSDISVVLVDVVAQRISLIEPLVALGTRVVVKRDVLSHAGSALELCIAVGASVRHYINN